MNAAIDAAVSDVLTHVHVMELSTIGKRGLLNTRPMNGVWLPDVHQVILTTPVAYPAKAFNVRRDSRVAVFCSDLTGSGLEGGPTVLIQGTGTAPDVVTTPQDTPEFWRAAFRKSHPPAEQFLDTGYQEQMNWFFWRLVITVRPDHVHLAEPAEVGGAWEPPAPVGAPIHEQILDAVQRYPTAVFTTRDRRGYPYSTRARVTVPGPGRYLVRPMQPFAGGPGPANLLWHRHNGQFDEISDLLVSGVARSSGQAWQFTPERIPGQLDTNRDTERPDAWLVDARQRSERYLQRRGLRAPVVDWTALANYASR